LCLALGPGAPAVADGTPVQRTPRVDAAGPRSASLDVPAVASRPQPRVSSSPGLSQQAQDGHRVIAALAPRPTMDFRMLGLTWAAGSAPEGLVVETRVRNDGAWSEWEHLHVHEHEGGDAPREGTAPLWVGQADGVELRVAVPRGGDDRRPKDMELELIEPGRDVGDPVRRGFTLRGHGEPETQSPPASTEPTDGSSDAEPESTSKSRVAPMLATTQPEPFVTKPKIITRRQWGADERLGSSCWDPYADTAKAVFVHHTVGTNNYAKWESDDLVRGIHRYHTNGNGWCDIGYNFLVDRYGQIFEGRGGGIRKPVRGAHAGDVNEGSVGISLMGNFETAYPTKAMKDRLVRLIAWQLETRYRNPRGTTWLAGRQFNVISGHRDAMSTACPGRHVYAWLPVLHDRVANRVGDWRASPIYQTWQDLGGENGRVGSPFIGERWSGDGRYTVFNHARIFWHPNPGAHEVRGGILGKYLSLGGVTSVLGWPVSDERDAAVPSSRTSAFQRGRIYRHRDTGAHAVHGAIARAYRRAGGAGSPLGLPVSDEGDAATPGSRTSAFQRGRIYWHADTRAHEVYGGILRTYRGMGGTASPLGLPTSGEEDAAVPGSRRNVFQRGHIYWHRDTGAHEVHGGILGAYLRHGGAESTLGLPVSDEYDVPGGRRSDFQGGHILWDYGTRSASVRYE